MNRDLLLKEYHPESEAVTAAHEVLKPRFPVIDIHAHMGKLLLGENYAERYDTAVFMRRMRGLGVQKLCNLDGFFQEDFEKMRQKTAGYEEEIFHFVWIDAARIGEPGFEKAVRAHIADAVKKGARGIKMWKDISLYMRDENGGYLRTDDYRLRCVYEAAAKFCIRCSCTSRTRWLFSNRWTAKTNGTSSLCTIPNGALQGIPSLLPN